MKDSKLKTAGMRKLHWGKAVVSIVVTLAAMPLTHSLARVLKEGTTGVEQFYAGMGMGAFGLFMVIAGVFVKGHIRQTLIILSPLLYSDTWQDIKELFPASMVCKNQCFAIL